VERDEQSRRALIDRINKALYRVTHGEGLMRVPADPTDVDLVLADCRHWLEGEAGAGSVAAPAPERPDAALKPQPEPSNRQIESITIMRFRKMLDRIGIHGYYNEMMKEFGDELPDAALKPQPEPQRVKPFPDSDLSLPVGCMGDEMEAYACELRTAVQQEMATPSAPAARLEEAKWWMGRVEFRLDHAKDQCHSVAGRCACCGRIAELEAALSAEAKGKA